MNIGQLSTMQLRDTIDVVYNMCPVAMIVLYPSYGIVPNILYMYAYEHLHAYNLGVHV